ALDVLHDEVGQTIIGRAGIEQACDVGVIERGQNLTLAMESANDGLAVELATDDFDRNQLLIGVVGAGCQVDASHAAAADLAVEPIRPNAPPAEVLTILQEAHAVPERCRLGEAARLIRGKERYDLFTQQRVVVAPCIQKSTARFGVAVESRLKQLVN